MSKAELKTWFDSLVQADEQKIDIASPQKRKFFVSDSVPTFDFNKEIIRPGSHKEFPEGVVGLRTDDDFFIVGAIPYKFHVLSCQDICEIVFKHLMKESDFVYYPDVNS